MGSAKSMLQRLSVSLAGRRHSCRSNQKHILIKGQAMLVLKENRDERHYCTECALKFINTAERELQRLKMQLKSAEE